MIELARRPAQKSRWLGFLPAQGRREESETFSAMRRLLDQRGESAEFREHRRYRVQVLGDAQTINLADCIGIEPGKLSKVSASLRVVVELVEAWSAR